MKSAPTGLQLSKFDDARRDSIWFWRRLYTLVRGVSGYILTLYDAFIQHFSAPFGQMFGALKKVHSFLKR